MQPFSSSLMDWSIERLMQCSCREACYCKAAGGRQRLPRLMLYLHYVALHHVTLRYIMLCYVMLRYVTLRYVTLRYITLHYTTLHYTTLHYTVLYGTLQGWRHTAPAPLDRQEQSQGDDLHRLLCWAGRGTANWCATLLCAAFAPPLFSFCPCSVQTFAPAMFSFCPCSCPPFAAAMITTSMRLSSAVACGCAQKHAKAGVVHNSNKMGCRRHIGAFV